MLTPEYRLLFNLVFVRGVTDRAGLAGILGMPGTLGHYDAAITKQRKMSYEFLPDFCISCLTCFDYCQGGRARTGCSNCGETDYTVGSLNHQKMSLWTCYTQDYTDYLLSQAYKLAEVG